MQDIDTMIAKRAWVVNTTNQENKLGSVNQAQNHLKEPGVCQPRLSAVSSDPPFGLQRIVYTKDGAPIDVESEDFWDTVLPDSNVRVVLGS